MCFKIKIGVMAKKHLIHCFFIQEVKDHLQGGLLFSEKKTGLMLIILLLLMLVYSFSTEASKTPPQCSSYFDIHQQEARVNSPGAQINAALQEALRVKKKMKGKNQEPRQPSPHTSTKTQTNKRNREIQTTMNRDEQQIEPKYINNHTSTKASIKMRRKTTESTTPQHDLSNKPD